jgi:hypothetical protein
MVALLRELIILEEFINIMIDAEETEYGFDIYGLY